MAFAWAFVYRLARVPSELILARRAPDSLIHKPAHFLRVVMRAQTSSNLIIQPRSGSTSTARSFTGWKTRPGVLVINKGPGATLMAGISITDFQPESGAITYSYGIPQDEAARTGTGSPDIDQASLPARRWNSPASSRRIRLPCRCSRRSAGSNSGVGQAPPVLPREP